MKLFSPKQATFITTKKIKVGGFYSFPSLGFTVYENSDYSKGASIETNPFTKSLDHELFIVKEITENGLVRVNLINRPRAKDFYLSLHEIENRGLITMLFLLLILTIPFLLYNLYTSNKKKSTATSKI